MTIREIIVQDYNAISQSDKKSTLKSVELKGAIAYAKEMLQKDPNDATIKPWLTIIAQRESDNTNIRYQLDELKDFVDASGKRIIPAPVFDRLIPSNKTIEPATIAASPENIKDIKSLLLSRKKGHIELAIKNGFYPIPKDKKSGVENYIEDKFAIMNSAIDAKDSFSERRLKQRAQEAYKDIIYCVTNGGNMNRPSEQGEEIVFRMNGSDVQDAKDYLLNLINKEIPASKIKSDVQDAKDNTRPDTQKTEAKEEVIESDNDLKKYASFATRELGKIGKTIKDLQTVLVMKLDIPLVINGVFDQSTLDAVRAFQQSVPNIKYGDDGLVGPVTIGELFGKTNLPTEGGNKIDRVGKPETNDSIIDIHKQLTTAYTDFSTYASKIDTWFGTLKNSKEDIQNQHIELNKKIRTLVDLFDKHEKNSNTSIKDTIAAYRLNLSYYLVNDLEGIGNSFNKNIIVSQNLAITVLNQDKKRIEPIPEGKQAIFATLDSIKNTPLGNTVAEALQQNPDKDIYEIISNPTIKGGWESAYSKIFDKYLTSLDTAIDTTGKDNTLTPHQKKALHHLKDIRGKNGWYQLKAENVTAMWQFAKVGGAVVAGAAATYLSAGTLGPLAAAGVGALVATGGTAMARGYWDGRETLIDGGINMLSFGGGALVVKLGQTVRGTQVVSSMGKVGSIGTGVAIDGIGNIGIGVAGDGVRAHLHGEDLDKWDSLKMNAIPWAIFALVMNARGFKVPPKVLEKAKDVEKSVAHAEAMAHVGGSPKADLNNIAAKGPELEAWGKTQHPEALHSESNHAPTPSNSTVNPRKSARVEPDTYAAIDKHSPVVAARLKMVEKGQFEEVSNGSGIDGYFGKNIEGKYEFIRLDKQSEPKTFNTVKEAHDHMTHEGFRFKDEIRIENNMKLSDPDRIMQVEKILGELSEKQKEALLLAHNAGNTPQNLRVKIDILSQEINGAQLFTKEQRRVLIEEGYVGKSARSQQAAQGAGTHGATHENNPSTRTQISEGPKANSHIDSHTATAVSDHAAKTVNQTIVGWTDYKAVKIAWDLATKEIQPGGAIKSILVFPANIIRLPLINARKIAELWIKKGDKGFEFIPGWENLGNTAKIAATASSKPFEGKTQSLLTLMTMGTVAYMTWEEIHKANPNTPVSLTWGLAVSYLKNMNIALPKEFADWFFKNKINV